MHIPLFYTEHYHLFIVGNKSSWCESIRDSSELVWVTKSQRNYAFYMILAAVGMVSVSESICWDVCCTNWLIQWLIDWLNKKERKKIFRKTGIQEDSILILLTIHGLKN